jgi:tetratricopeptide (TPR) repeat protein
MDAERAEIIKLRGLLASDPNNAPLLQRCAQLALELRHYDDALVAASAALKAAPGNPDAMFCRASALIGLKHYKEAAQCLTVLQNHGLTDPGISINRALCHYLLSEFAEALAQLEPLIAAGHTSADILRLAVSSRHHLGDIDAAIALADAHPGAAADGAVAGVYALAYLDAGRASESARYGAAALAKNPDSIDGLTVVGTLALANMQTAPAESTFRRVLELQSGNGRAWIALGTIALLAQDLPKAQSLLERGVEAMPAHVGSWHMLGWTHLVAGDLDSAERIFRHALVLERNFAETHGALASVHALRDQVAAARAEIEIAERLDRSGLAARLAAAVLAARSGNRSDATKLVRTTIAGLIPRVGVRAGRILAAAVRPTERTRH